MLMKPYCYKIKNIRVIDGDSFECDMDLGCSITLHKQKIRLLDVDCYEVKNTPKAREQAKLKRCEVSLIISKGLDAAAFTYKYLTGPILMTTVSKDSFGRWLAIVAREGDNLTLNSDLKSRGHTV